MMLSFYTVSVPVPLGFESGELKDVDLSASTIKDGHEAWRASLRGTNCWMPQYDDTQQYFTVFLSDIKVKLSAIATQGAVYEACWITAYTLHVSHPRGKWNWYKENGVVKVSNDLSMLWVSGAHLPELSLFRSMERLGVLLLPSFFQSRFSIH